MKRFALFIVSFLVWAVPAVAAESVQRFTSHIDVLADSTLRITETVVYDMDDVQRHGWERTIPKQSVGGPRIVIRDIAATRDGVADRVNVSDTSGALRIRIGEPDVTMSGIHTYVLSYTVFNEVRYFDDRDELYWNAVPQKLELPIAEASATVTFPEGSSIIAGPFCYTGASGETESDCVVSAEGNVVTAQAQRQLSAQEGMTVAAAIAPGGITRVAPIDDTDEGSIIVILMLIVLGIGAFFVFIVRPIIRYNSLPKRRADGGDIVVQYDPPADCSVAEAAYMAQPSGMGRMVTAGVVQLAVDGWLKMEFAHTKAWLGNKVDITFHRLKEIGHPSDPILDKIHTTLFIGGPERKLSDLKKDMKGGAMTNYAVSTDIIKSFEARGWMERVYKIFTTYSASGNATKEYLSGLRLYLGAAEKERLEFHNAPEKSPERFERLLPWAIALGVDGPWAASFGDMQYQPTWATGDTSMLSAVSVAHAMGDLSSGVNSVVNTYSSGTGGGSGGGGSSGGGGGGGGGGGW